MKHVMFTVSPYNEAMRENTAPEEQEKTETASTTKRARKPRSTKKTTSVATVGQSPATAISAKEAQQFGRVVILDFTPRAEDEIYAARVELGEVFRVGATVFMESKHTVGATAVLKNQRGRIMARVPMTQTNAGLNQWEAMLQAGEATTVAPWNSGFADIQKNLGKWKVSIEGWNDSYADWVKTAQACVANNCENAENILAQGASILTRWASSRDAAVPTEAKAMMRQTAKEMADTSVDAADRIAIAQAEEIAQLNRTNPLRDGLTQSEEHIIHVERPKSSFASWYQCFPASQGAHRDLQSETIIPGTFDSASPVIQRAQDEGFSIIHVSQIMPTNTAADSDDTPVTADADDAPVIGVSAHDTVNPELGTMADFASFCNRAHSSNLEVAIDFSLTCASNHPWLTSHPEWFNTQADGTIAADPEHADIRPLNFDNDREGLEAEVVRCLEVWINAGVTIFQIINADAQPIRFWQDIIATVTKKHPEVLFLSQSFTHPAIVRALSYAGFTQVQSYFPWRNSKEELEQYFTQANSEASFYQHDTFWPTTADVLSDYVRNNGVAGHAVRAVLAAFGSPSWGMPSGYELTERSENAQGANERTRPLVRNWEEADNLGLAELITNLNNIRNEHPAAHSYHNFTILPSANPNIIAFTRFTPGEYTGTGKADMLIVVVNLDCYNEQQSSIHVDLPKFGLPTDGTYRVHDLLTNREFDWSWDNFVSLAPWADVAHILHVEF